MADRGFEMEEDLMLIRVRLNIPPFLCSKKQLSEIELVCTRRIASLQIYVEGAMERIKNFHIFDRTIPSSLTDIADRIFFVCCVLTNISLPLNVKHCLCTNCIHSNDIDNYTTINACSTNNNWACVLGI